MSILSKSSVGLAVGGLMAGGVWIFMRTQDRKALVDLFLEDKNITILRALAPYVPVPKKLALIESGDLEGLAAQEILFTNTVAPRKVYDEYAKDIKKYIASVPDGALDKVVKSLGLDPSVLGKLKDALGKLRELTGGSSDDSGVKQRPQG
jgi:hypothetical protein